MRGDIEESINWQGGDKAPSYYNNFDQIDWSKGVDNPTPVKITCGKAKQYYSNIMLEVKDSVAEARKPPHLKKNLVG